MGLLGWGAGAFAGRYLRKIDAFCADGQGAQKEVLRYILTQLARTAYGQSHGARELGGYEDFARQIPLVGYEGLEPYIHEMRMGARDVLWPGRVVWYARSSGTSNSTSKYIPVPPAGLRDCHYRGGYDVLALYIRNNPRTRFFLGKGLTLGGSHQIEETAGVSKEGDLSAILLQNIPRWADMIRTPSRAVVLEPDWEKKLAGIACESLGKRVTSLSGVPSWNMVMLKYLLDVSGKSDVRELWPDLEVFFHGGVSFTPYRQQYERLIPGGGMHYMETYNASEGFFAIQDDPQRSDMLLMLDYGIFFEFIDMDEFHKKDRRAVPIWAVERGRNYAMVISGNNGLWRYIIGDTVEFTGTSPYRIRITGRTKHYINAFGEEISIDNAEKAIRQACQATDAIVEEYTAGPMFMGEDARGGHEWYLEFAQQPRDLALFCAALDAALRGLNSDYDAKRTGDVTLHAPVVHAVEAGTFVGWMAWRGKLGGQNKVPRLYSDRTHLESMAQYLRERQGGSQR